ncbi:MAG: hypothetical protein WCB53_12970, partial [Terriglobales bacterium]
MATSALLKMVGYLSGLSSPVSSSRGLAVFLDAEYGARSSQRFAKTLVADRRSAVDCIAQQPLSKACQWARCIGKDVIVRLSSILKA